MKFEECFKKENLELLFDCTKHENEFIACARDYYSEFASKDSYSGKWAWGFPAGRYVIVVYQRYAVYKDGIQIYLNDNFKNVVSKYCRYKELRYSLITKKQNEYYISSWRRNLVTHHIKDENEPLQDKYFSSIVKAVEASVEYSKNGNTVAIVSWYADYNMY